MNRDLVGRDKELLSQQMNWFRGVVATKTEQNWRWYIFGLLMAQMFESYSIAVETASDPNAFRQAVLNWISHYCFLRIPNGSVIPNLSFSIA
ncbi:hypothetical protein Ciccas_001697 [Cichlidogyrus casuarinus]|uniref:Uncharacterized protein n=1 Tax=Cichlidogyrus casuarinus TaxID=1844966 RepID=A0ABD2QJB3_9PLAT